MTNRLCLLLAHHPYLTISAAIIFVGLFDRIPT